MAERPAAILIAALVLAVSSCGAGEGPPAVPGLAVRLALHDARGNEARTFAASAPIHLRIELANESATSASLRFSSGRTHDVVIIGQGGDPVWRWSDGRIFTQALTEIELGPGEAHRFGVVCEAEAQGRPALPPGRYRAVAVIPRFGAELRSPPIPLQVQ